MTWVEYIQLSILNVQSLQEFKAKIEIIGVNPYVLLPQRVLKAIFKAAGKDRGKIPVKIKIDGHAFSQTLIKYSGHWRLYLNTPMRRAAAKDVGDRAQFAVAYDPIPRTVPMPEKLQEAINQNHKAKRAFECLSPSRQKEIVRYIANLKSEEAVEKNINRAINFLSGSESFAGIAPAGSASKKNDPI
jgi:hypothetical protein